MDTAEEIAASKSWPRVIFLCLVAVTLGHVIWAIAKYGSIFELRRVHFLL